MEAAKKAALTAGDFLLSGLDKKKVIQYKGPCDLVTEMDRRAEEIIKEILSERFPHVSFLAEESGETGQYSGSRWIIDPLDGTTSYSHGLPHFCVSIALEVDGEVLIGVVFNPCLDECFTAALGKGALLNGSSIYVSETAKLSLSLLATGFPYDRKESLKNNIDNFRAFMMAAQGIRRMGSAALDLCYTACGRFDGFWELKLKPWDTAAAALIVKEAGGILTDFGGRDYCIYSSEILASNGPIHNKMIEVLKGA